MGALIQREIYRLFHSPQILLMAVGILLVCTYSCCTHIPIGGEANAVFVYILGQNRYLGLWGPVLSTYYYAVDYQSRMYNVAIYRGKHRMKIFFAKLIGYLILSMLLSFMTRLLTIGFVIPSFFRNNMSTVFRKILLYLLLDLQIWAIPLLIVHIVKKIIFSISLSLAYSFLRLNQTAFIPNNNDIVFTQIRESFPFFIVCAGLSLIIFEKSDLQ